MKTRYALIFIIVAFMLLYPIQTYLDTHRPPEDKVDKMLFINSGKMAKRLSFGFDGLLADFYWLRSVQYFGRQMLDDSNNFDMGRTSQVQYDLLFPLLDITTTLDPAYIEAYRFGGLFLPDYSYDQALKLLNKGIENNPTNWKLYQSLGTLYWSKKDYQHASESFLKGGEQPNAPYWMKILGGVMLTQGGSRKTACQIYTTFYEEAKNSNDTLTITSMEAQLRRLYSLDEVDYLNVLLKRYKEATDKCPTSLTALVPTLKERSNYIGACGQEVQIKLNNKGEIVSPLGEVYRFDEKNCKAQMPFELYEP